MQQSKVQHPPLRRQPRRHQEQPASPKLSSSSFLNHTPREFELSRVFRSALCSSELVNDSTISVLTADSAGGLQTCDTAAADGEGGMMGQRPSSPRESNEAQLQEVRTFEADEQEPVKGFSRPDSWSLNYTCTDQAPYCELISNRLRRDHGDSVVPVEMTNMSTSLLPISRRHDVADLVWFLKNTGPPAPHRRPSKFEERRKGIVATSSQRALRMLRGGQKGQGGGKWNMSEIHLADVGGLLSPAIPPGLANTVEQRSTSSGRKYLAMKVREPAPKIEADIVDSHVSISFQEDVMAYDVVDEYLLSRGRSTMRPVTPLCPQPSSPEDMVKDNTVRFVDYSSSPVRPTASSPPTPRPDSAVSTESSYDIVEQPAKRVSSPCRALTSHPIRQGESLTALPKISLPQEAFPVKHPGAEKPIKIWQPTPRRLASNPVLLQRAPSTTSSLYPRSTSESPGPPPPRSPLRLCPDPRTIEDVIALHNRSHARTITPRLAVTPKLTPTMEVSPGYNEILAAMKPTVVTECTGPIKRPRSRGSTAVRVPTYPLSRREREEKIKARRLRDRSQSQTLDALIKAAPIVPPRQLRKARPQIHIPELRPMPLVTRASSSASTDASWKKVTENTRVPVSPVPSQEMSVVVGGENTRCTAISPTVSNDGANIQTLMALSPIMLVAEEIPVPTMKSRPKPPEFIIKGSKNFAPRPRSASIPKNAFKRQSRNVGPETATQVSSRRSSSAPEITRGEEGPPLPSPPPNRELPPTPPTSESERPGKAKAIETKKELPTPPAYEIMPKDARDTGRADTVPHVVTQAQRKNVTSKEARIEARLKQLEKHNAMLEAALMAVLRINGSVNSPFSALMASEPDSPKTMAWESRIARRSAASHTASSSNGSALDMYISTRRGSKIGCGGV